MEQIAGGLEDGDELVADGAVDILRGEGKVLVAAEEEGRGAELVAGGEVCGRGEVGEGAGAEVVEGEGGLETDALEHVGPVW